MAEPRKHHTGSRTDEPCGCSGKRVRSPRTRSGGESLVAQDNPDDSQLGADRTSEE
ncbi:MAG TPA: hypothetical protein VIL07_08155 [Symbiobacteriaceae bacterium]